ncbi:CRISPR-associated protein, Cmr5 family [Tindallia magadiensis]|uniref:CRISPR type III-B/RAMP module-associated protein Cmr5 n=1 Tax=Tindallia magadiensis TaxID=69895 RepID=A0A1I3ENJ8_9FIRM|nr:type III-B CRISPR module-associated protein Cmr5 [Tindallia magadiensis]SFI00468.1 CRISPR-associated protein, Cmr5 family [Tindallia magadiensis]
MSRRKDIEMERANTAYDSIMELHKKEESDSKDFLEKTKASYRAYAKKLPMLILNNGFGASIAFVNSKKGKGKAEERAYDFLYKHIQKRLRDTGLADEKDLMETIVKSKNDDYRQMTKEALAFLNWLRRFAEAEFKGDVQE